MKIRLRRPGSRACSAAEMCAFIDRDMPPFAPGECDGLDGLYCDLSPSSALQRSLDDGELSSDAFIAAYELELDLVPAARFAVLVAHACRDQLALISNHSLAAQTLRRYLYDMAALRETDEVQLNEAARECATVVNEAYQAVRSTGASHAKAVCASRKALRRISAAGEP